MSAFTATLLAASVLAAAAAPASALAAAAEPASIIYPVPQPAPHPEFNGLIAKESTSPKVYVVIDGYLRWIPDPATYNALFSSWSCIRTQDAITAMIATGSPLPSGAVLIRGQSTPQVYLVTDGGKRWITDPSTFNKHCFDWNKIVLVPQLAVNYIPTRPNIQIV